MGASPRWCRMTVLVLLYPGLTNCKREYPRCRRRSSSQRRPASDPLGLDTRRVCISTTYHQQIERSGNPQTSLNGRHTRSDPFPDTFRLPQGAPSPRSPTRPYAPGEAAADHPGQGEPRRRPIQSRISANRSRDTATLAIWNVTSLAWRTTFAPVSISFSRSAGSVQVRTGR